MTPRETAIAKQLYALVPEIYRYFDYDSRALEEFLRVIAAEYALFSERLTWLYDDFFIETSHDWAVPLIGDLVGYQPLHSGKTRVMSPRREIANTVRNRRRKGTIAMLANLASDVTGWGVEVIDCTEALATFRAPSRTVRESTATIDVGRPRAMHRMADVRSAARAYGGYLPRHLILNIWRVQALPVTDSPAAPAESANDQEYYFHPAGVETPLFHREHGISKPLSRETLRRNLNDLFGVGKALSVRIEGVPLAAEEVEVTDLSRHRTRWRGHTTAKHLLDPERGKLVLATNRPAPAVSYAYGAAANIGAGTYLRPEPRGMSSFDLERVARHDLTKPLTVVGPRILEFPGHERVDGRIVITVHGGHPVYLSARNREMAIVTATEFVIVGHQRADVTFDGLLVLGSTLHLRGSFERVRVQHCTFTRSGRAPHSPAPPSPSVVAEAGVESLELDHTILQRIAADRITNLSLRSCIVDAGSDAKIALSGAEERFPCGPLSLERCTVVGRVEATDVISISDSIVTGLVHTHRPASGTARFSYLPAGSTISDRYECIPARETALDVKPHFVSQHYGNPSYLLLADYCSELIARGAEDGSQMGAYQSAYWPVLDSNLRARINQNLPIGIRAGVVHFS